MHRLFPRTSPLGCLMFLVLLVAPATAHTLKTSGNVAATFHIEPNHNPKAGEPAPVWFALTRQGGEVIPLVECNCKLAVYPDPHKQGSAPLMEPALKSISTQPYQGIPGAEIVFPKAGAYQLRLSGTPKDGKGFKPFELTYSVTVGAGTATPMASLSPTGEHSHNMAHNDKNKSAQLPDQSASQWQTPMAILAGVLGLGGLGLVVRGLKNGKS